MLTKVDVDFDAPVESPFSLVTKVDGEAIRSKEYVNRYVAEAAMPECVRTATEEAKRDGRPRAVLLQQTYRAIGIEVKPVDPIKVLHEKLTEMDLSEEEVAQVVQLLGRSASEKLGRLLG